MIKTVTRIGWIAIAGLLAFTLAGSASAQELPPEFAGTWRFEGEGAMGPYAGEMTIRREGGRLTYIRKYDDQLPTETGGESGRLLQVGRLALTQQKITPGLLTLFGGNRKRVPQRHGVYRVETPFKLSGTSFTAATMIRTRETLYRQGAGAPDNHVELLVDGEEFFPALREALGKAQSSIHFQTFIFKDDRTGGPILDLLIERARAGVEVKLLVDNMGWEVKKARRKELEAAGIEVIVQHTWGKGIGNSLKGIGSSIWNGLKGLFGGKKPAKKEKRGVFNHDHRKLTVIDRELGFIGGMNIAKEYEFEWHDIHTHVRGGVVAQMSELFADRWQAAGGEMTLQTPTLTAAAVSVSGPPPGHMQVDLVDAVPGLKHDIFDRYMREIGRARRAVRVEMAYLLNDDILKGFERAARRGCETIVIIPGDEIHDVKIVRDAFVLSENDLVRSGVQLYKYRDRMVHSKVASFDGRVATVGSSNLDDMALFKLAEANVFVTDRGFTRTLDERVFVRDVPNSDKVEVKKVGWWKTLKSGFLRLFRGLL